MTARWPPDLAMHRCTVCGHRRDQHTYTRHRYAEYPDPGWTCDGRLCGCTTPSYQEDTNE